jgi:hypothetical protein
MQPVVCCLDRHLERLLERLLDFQRQRWKEMDLPVEKNDYYLQTLLMILLTRLDHPIQRFLPPLHFQRHHRET